MKVFFKSSKGKDGFDFMESHLFSNNINDSDLFRIVGNIEIETLNQPVNFATLTQIAESFELDVLIINDSLNPKIVKILDMQKYIYEMKKARKENDKKQKALQAKNKEIRISLNISEHDLDMKVKHTKEFADEGSKVKFILRLRGREGAGPEGKKYVHNFFDGVLTKFEGYNFEPVKIIGNSIWTEITKEK